MIHVRVRGFPLSNREGLSREISSTGRSLTQAQRSICDFEIYNKTSSGNVSQDFSEDRSQIMALTYKRRWNSKNSIFSGVYVPLKRSYNNVIALL